MNINNISFPNLNKSNNKITNKETKNNNKVQSIPQDLKQCPTQALQAYNNISFGKKAEIQHTYFVKRDEINNPTEIKATIQLDNGETTLLTIDSETIQDYILSDTIEEETDKTSKFLEVYKTLLSKIEAQDKSEKELLQSIADGTNKPVKQNNKGYFIPNEELVDATLSALGSNENEFVKKLFDNIANPKVRQDFARQMLTNTMDMEDANKDKAFVQTLIVLDLTKTQTSYDLSHLEEDITLMKDIDDLEYNFTDAFDREEFIDECRNEDGSINYDYAHKLKKFLRQAAFFTPHESTQFHSNLMRKMVAKSPAQEDEICNALTEFATFYTVVPDENLFERQFEKAFNPVSNRFDTEAYETLKEIQKKTEKLYDQLYTHFSGVNELQKFEDEEVRFVEMYMDSIKDTQTGNIKRNHLSPEEFIKQFIQQ